MAASIPFFKQLTPEMVESSSFKITKKYLYTPPEGGERDLGDPAPKGRSFGDDYWEVVSDGLVVRARASVAYMKVFLGPDGVAPAGADLDVAIRWRSKKTTSAGISPSAYRTAGPSGTTFDFEVAFHPGTLAGDLEIEPVLYIKSPSPEVAEGEERLMNEAGAILGPLEEATCISFDGTDGRFPIVEASDPSAPLWWVEYSEWGDPRSDAFSDENVRLVLNTARKDCPKMGMAGIKGQEVLREIVASAYYLIFEKVREHSEQDPQVWDDLVNGENLEPGSICSALYELTQAIGESFDWGVPEKRMRSIKAAVDASFEEGGEDE